MRPDYGVNAYSGQASQKEYHDSCSKDTHFSIGQKVMTRNFLQGTPWLPGVVKECCGPLTYMVEVESGVLWRRHVDHIKDRHELELVGEETETEHQRMSEDAVENTNKDQQISVDTNESTEAAGQEVVHQEMVEPPTANSDESEDVKCDDPEVVLRPEVHGRTEGNSPPEAEARRYPTRERRKPDRYGWS